MTIGLNFWIALLGYACVPLAWWACRNGRAGSCMIAIMLCAALVRLSASLDPFLHPWDERYHALVGKHLAQDMLTPTLYPDPRLPHDPANWTFSHIWVHKPPITLWSIAASIKLFGATPLAVRIPSIVFSALAALLLFRLGTAMVSRSVGLWAALLFAINGHLLELASGRTSTDHVDAVFVAVVLAAIWAASRMSATGSHGWALACGALAGCAFLTKSWPSFVILPIALAMLHANEVPLIRNGWKLLLTACAAALIITLPWVIYTHVRFSAESAITDAAIWTRFGQGLDTHSRPWHYYLVQVPMMHGEAAAILLPWSMYHWWRDRSGIHAVLLAWILVPILVFSAAETKMPAYVAISAPAWCILIAMGVHALWHSQAVGGWGQWALRGIAVLLIALPLRFSWSRLKPLDQPVPTYAITDAWREAAPNTIVMDCPFPIELMFHTSIAAAYAHSLDEGTVARLENDGFSIVHFAAVR